MTITLPIGQWIAEAEEDRNFAKERESGVPPLEAVVLRHPNCAVAHCHLCLNDALRLQAYLDHHKGLGSQDSLGIYRSWLDKHADRFGPAETEHGWFSAVVFQPEVIQEFVAHD